MTPSVREERGVVSEMYDGPKWKKKVDKMSHNQVHAIYMKHTAKLDKAAKDAKESEDLGF